MQTFKGYERRLRINTVLLCTRKDKDAVAPMYPYNMAAINAHFDTCTWCQAQARHREEHDKQNGWRDPDPTPKELESQALHEESTYDPNGANDIDGDAYHGSWDTVNPETGH
ncbi:MAG: hypothetical protein WC609_02850 [Candidatus Paceibacterota bacterium]|jgi:hypothetical protein